ncbi:hypothetical protein G6L85_22680 [Agrobacterium rhizogenes]|nr:hypothetical protein [Rhizobium rhizogenes]
MPADADQFRERRFTFPDTSIEQRKAAIDGAMTIMKIARLPDQISEFCALGTTGIPIDLGNRTGPCLIGKDIGNSVAERTVGACIVRNL